ncbi:MAG: hypothetical protein LBN39_05545 [Planctomycetaceae bacterium]|jgi:hypothetical protein|nr:hypothetical protein [Planctomycetaceae bacterium]
MSSEQSPTLKQLLLRIADMVDMLSKEVRDIRSKLDEKHNGHITVNQQIGNL